MTTLVSTAFTCASPQGVTNLFSRQRRQIGVRDGDQDAVSMLQVHLGRWHLDLQRPSRALMSMIWPPTRPSASRSALGMITRPPWSMIVTACG